MTNNKEKIVNNLINILESKLNLLKQIYNFTRQQTKSIQEDKIEALNRILDSKHVRIEKIIRLDREYSTLLQIIQDGYNVSDVTKFDMTQDKRELFVTLNQQIDEVVQALYELDCQNTADLKQKQRNLQDKIKKINAGKNTRKNYEKQAIQFNGVFLDKKR